MNAVLRISLSSTILWLVFMFNAKVGLFRPYLSFHSYKQTIRAHAKPLGKRLSPCAEMPNLSGNDFCQAWKCQTLRETTFAMRGNAKPLGKRLSPSAEMPNPSGNDFRQARKCQTLRETTFAKRGNVKPFGKWLSPCAEMSNHSGNNFRQARKISFWPFCSVQKHEKLLFSLSAACRSVKNFFLVFLQCAEAWKTSFWPFCSVQKHEKLLFGLSAVCRSVKIFFLAFLQCAEAWKSSFWSFCSVQKHVFKFRRPTTCFFIFSL